MNVVLDFMLKDTCYIERINMLLKLHQEGTFDCNNVAKQLIDQVFTPLMEAMVMIKPEKGPQSTRTFGLK